MFKESLASRHDWIQGANYNIEAVLIHTYKYIHLGKLSPICSVFLKLFNILLACPENLDFMNLISESFRFLTHKRNYYNKNKNKHTKIIIIIIIITKRPIYLHDQNLREAIPRSNTQLVYPFPDVGL